MTVDGHRLELNLVERAHPTPGDLARIQPSEPGRPTVVVADRISTAGRETLRSLGMNWLDRRGHVRLWLVGLRLDMPFTPVTPRRIRAVTSFTPAVRDVAFALLSDPSTKPSPRRLGVALDRSPGYVSTILTSLAEDGLLDDDGTPLLPDLFWALASAWPTDWIYLTEDFESIRHVADGVITGAHGGALWGAPALVSQRETVHVSVDSQITLRRILESSTEATRPTKARSAIRSLDHTIWKLGVIATGLQGTPEPHPLLCALDVAVDQRGRETLEHWRSQRRDAGVLALLDVLDHTRCSKPSDLADVILRRNPTPIAVEALVTACWQDARELAVVFEHPNTEKSTRQIVHRRLDTLIKSDATLLSIVVDEAPSLLRTEPYRTIYVPDKVAPNGQIGLLVWEVEQAFLASEAIAALVLRRWTENLLTDRDLFTGSDRDRADTVWNRAELAHYLLRLADIADLTETQVTQLRVLADAPAVPSMGSDPSRWTEWSSGPDPAWKYLAEQARSGGQLSRSSLRRLISEILAVDLEDQAIPLCEILPHADESQQSQLLDSILLASQAVSDLHIRAKVLAEASQYATDERQSDFVEGALTAARAATRQTTPSLLGGPDPGGIRGLMEVVPKLHGTARRTLLQETARSWITWVDPSPDEVSPNNIRRPDRRMLFFGSDDLSVPLVRWLVVEHLAPELRAVFSVIRKIAGEHGNALEIILADGGWPGLLAGDLEVAAVFVSEARTETVSAARYREEPIDQVDDQPDADSFPPFKTPTFPSELLQFRNVWL